MNRKRPQGRFPIYRGPRHRPTLQSRGWWPMGYDEMQALPIQKYFLRCAQSRLGPWPEATPITIFSELSAIAREYAAALYNWTTCPTTVQVRASLERIPRGRRISSSDIEKLSYPALLALDDAGALPPGRLWAIGSGDQIEWTLDEVVRAVSCCSYATNFVPAYSGARGRALLPAAHPRRLLVCLCADLVDDFAEWRPTSTRSGKFMHLLEYVHLAASAGPDTADGFRQIAREELPKISENGVKRFLR